MYIVHEVHVNLYMCYTSLTHITLITLSPVYVVMLCISKFRFFAPFRQHDVTSKPFWSLAAVS
jgi:hypothetical protein